MLRICKTCNEEKEITQFVKGKGELYRYLCKSCRCISRRTGLPNTGRFKPGHDKGKRFEIGHTPWYKVKGVDHPLKGTGIAETRNSAKTRDWCRKVKDRDGNKCTKCGSNERVAAHHIVPWKDNITLRFEVENGISLCNSCHGKEEGFKKGHITILSPESREKVTRANIGKIVSDETRKKMSEAKKGMKGTMTGKKMSEQSKLKMRLAKLGKPCNNGFKKGFIPWNKGIDFTIKEN